MPEVRANIFAHPGDTFTPGVYAPAQALQSVTMSAAGESWFSGPVTLFGDIDTLLALADSLVAAAWTLKTAAVAAELEASA